MRSILRAFGAVFLAGAAGLCGSLAVLAQDVPSAEAIEGMARVFTELDPQIKAVEMHSYFAPYSDAAGARRYLFRYASPDQYVALMALAEDRAAYMAAGEMKTIIYDFQRGRIVLVEGTVPIIRIESPSANVQVNWTINSTKKTSREPAAMLLVDFPSFLRHPSVRAREVESLGGGKYRLTHTTESNNRMIATVDASSPFAFTRLEVHAEGRLVFTLDLRVNQQMSTLGFSMPGIESLRARFKVEQTPAPEDIKAMLRIIGMMFLPLGFGTGSENRGIRDRIDKMLSEKHDWQGMEARYRRELPKLRQLLPMPQ